MDTQPRNNLAIPIAIVIAGALIAVSLFFVKGNSGQKVVQSTDNLHPEENMVPVSASDHILGNPNAEIMLVEYSDTDCPYCQSFQPTLHRIVTELGKDGKVAWVYRHFAFHPNAPKEAEATECVAEIGGNTKFFEYLDLLFSKKDFAKSPYVPLDPKQLPVLAASIGIDKAKFTSCLDSGKYTQKIRDEYARSIEAGAEGTPYTIIVTKSGKVPIKTGAVSYESLKAAVQALMTAKQ